jgi:putative hydrolase of the HAD superfamily
MIDAGIRAVFFDAVGTLLFPRRPVSRTYAEVARRHGATLPEQQIRERFRVAWDRQDRLDQLACWRTDEPRERARWRAIVAETMPEAPAGACFAELWTWFSGPDAWAVHPAAPDLLLELSDRGLAVGIGSNFDARLLRLVDQIPALAPVRGRTVVSSVAGWRKPAREFFAALVAAAGCEPSQLLYVGDDLGNDLEGASAAGLRAVLYDPEDQHPAYPRIRQLRDLLPG